MTCHTFVVFDWILLLIIYNKLHFKQIVEKNCEPIGKDAELFSITI